MLTFAQFGAGRIGAIHAANLAISGGEGGPGHLLRKKPIDLSLKRVDACIAAVKKSGVPMFVGFSRCFDPARAAISAKRREVTRDVKTRLNTSASAIFTDSMNRSQRSASDAA